MGETNNNPFKFKLGAQTNVGCVRTNNEDNFVVSADLNAGEWLLPRDCHTVFTDGNDTLVFIPKGGTIDLPVEYTVSLNEMPWEIYSYPNWCTATREGNASLALKCLSNKMKEDRDGTIFVKKGRRLISITVIQLGKGSKYMTFQPLFGKKKKVKSLYQRAVLFTPEED